jgi:hypothetical protein
LLTFILGMWAGGMIPVAISLYDARENMRWTGSAGDWVGAFFTTALWPATFLWFARDIIDDLRR